MGIPRTDAFDVWLHLGNIDDSSRRARAILEAQTKNVLSEGSNMMFKLKASQERLDLRKFHATKTVQEKKNLGF